MNIETPPAPCVGISFADLLRYNESEATKWRGWLEAQPSDLLDVPFGNAAKRMGNVREMIWHIFITEWVYACVLNCEPYDGWDQFKRDSVAELFAIGARRRARAQPTPTRCPRQVRSRSSCRPARTGCAP